MNKADALDSAESDARAKALLAEIEESLNVWWAKKFLVLLLPYFTTEHKNSPLNLIKRLPLYPLTVYTIQQVIWLSVYLVHRINPLSNASVYQFNSQAGGLLNSA